MKSEFDFVVSKQGRLKLIYKEYEFYHSFQTKGGITNWYCSQRTKGCAVRIKTNETGIKRKFIQVSQKEIRNPTSNLV